MGKHSPLLVWALNEELGVTTADKAKIHGHYHLVLILCTSITVSNR